MFKWLTESYPPRDVFECNNCGKKTPGRWCGGCPGERGTYWDKNGTPCKPTARINPERVNHMSNQNAESSCTASNKQTPNTDKAHLKMSYLRDLIALSESRGSVSDDESLEHRLTAVMDSIENDLGIARKDGDQ